MGINQSNLKYAVKLYYKLEEKWIENAMLSIHRTRAQARLARKEYEDKNAEKLNPLASPPYRCRVVKL